MLRKVPPKLIGSRSHEGLAGTPKDTGRGFKGAANGGLGGSPTQEKTLVAHLGAEPLPPRARGAQRPRGGGERGRAKSLGTTGSAQSVAPAHSDIVSSTTLLLSQH